MQFPQLGARVDAEFLSQRPAALLVGAERVGLVAVFFVSGGGGPLLQSGAHGLSRLLRSVQSAEVGRNFSGK